MTYSPGKQKTNKVGTNEIQGAEAQAAKAGRTVAVIIR
jgi:hypothetical protein